MLELWVAQLVSQLGEPDQKSTTCTQLIKVPSQRGVTVISSQTKFGDAVALQSFGCRRNSNCTGCRAVEARQRGSESAAIMSSGMDAEDLWELCGLRSTDLESESDDGGDAAAPAPAPGAAARAPAAKARAPPPTPTSAPVDSEYGGARFARALAGDAARAPDVYVAPNAAKGGVDLRARRAFARGEVIFVESPIARAAVGGFAGRCGGCERSLAGPEDAGVPVSDPSAWPDAGPAVACGSCGALRCAFCARRRIAEPPTCCARAAVSRKDSKTT